MEIAIENTDVSLDHVVATLSKLEDRRLGGGLDEYQEHQLRVVWERARKTSFYANLPSFSLPNFKALQPVPKDALKNDPAAFDAVGWEGVVRYYESSGTTGVATPTKRTQKDILWNYVSVWLQWRELVDQNDRCLILLPSDISPIGDLIVGVCSLSRAPTMRCFPFAQGIVSWDRIQAVGDRFRPTILWSAPGTLVQLLRILKRRGTFAKFAGSVRSIMLLGEVVSAQLRQRLATEWGAEVHVASYGSTETGTIAATGKASDLRLLDYSFLCEVKVGDSVVPARPGAIGELVITTLNADARPLIRFCTGDLVRLHRSSEGSWICVEVLGRSLEQVRIGNSVLSPLDIEEMIYKVDGVTAYQLISDDGEIVSIRLECDPDYTSRKAEVVQRAIAQARRQGIDVEMSIVDELPLTTKSGAGLKNWKRSNVVNV